MRVRLCGYVEHLKERRNGWIMLHDKIKVNICMVLLVKKGCVLTCVGSECVSK